MHSYKLNIEKEYGHINIKKYKESYIENKKDIEKLCGCLNELFMYFKEEYNPCDCNMCFLYPYHCCEKGRWRDNNFSSDLFKGDSNFEVKQLSKIRNFLTNKDKYQYLEKLFPHREILEKLTQLSKNFNVKLKIQSEELNKFRIEEIIRISNLSEEEKKEQKKLSNSKISFSGEILEKSFRNSIKIKQVIDIMIKNEGNIFSFMTTILKYLDEISKIKIGKINTKKNTKLNYISEYKKWKLIKENINKIKNNIKFLDTIFELLEL